MKRKLLWISLNVPYDTVNHAGGKCHNYYIKSFQKSQMYDIHLISFMYSYEKKHLDLDRYKIKNTLIEISDNKIKTFFRKVINSESALNPFSKYVGIVPNFQRVTVQRAIKEYAKTMESPEIIILEWTQIIVFLPLIKRLFPKSIIVAIEEDVAFLGYYRRVEYSKNFISRSINLYKYKKLKRLELGVLKKADIVTVNNPKDKKLIEHELNEKTTVVQISPFFDNYKDVKRNKKNKNLLYFGAMQRRENYLSVIWFIENVLVKIDDPEIKLVVVGGNPNKELLKYKAENVEILGFVEDIRPFLAESLCLVAPLVLGAGIKVKILEAFSSGIPVLTNNIGIEGINAVPNEHYFHCETPEEYIDVIKYLLKDCKESELSNNAKALIDKEYNLAMDMNQLQIRIEEKLNEEFAHETED